MTEFIGRKVCVSMRDNVDTQYICTFVDFGEAGIIVEFGGGARGFIPYTAILLVEKVVTA